LKKSNIENKGELKLHIFRFVIPPPTIWHLMPRYCAKTFTSLDG